MKYNGWLVSTNIFKRAVAIWGHFVLGYIIIIVVIFIPLMILGLIVGML